MKSYKERLNDATQAGNYLKELSPEESVALKRCILGIFKAVAAVCEEHGLTYMLAGGSCLGAVRHHGFIPWDDDLDMMLPRADYEKLLELVSGGALGDRYLFRLPDGKQEASIAFLKVFRKDTVLVGLLDGQDCPYPQKVFLDIFPLDGVPANRFLRKLKGTVADGLRLAGNMVADTRRWTEAQKAFYAQNPEMLRTIRRRRFFGRIFSVVPHRKWVFWFDRFVRDPDMTGLVGIPTGRKRYAGEIFQGNVYLPTVKGTFEGLEVPLPGDWDAYLKNLYRNYMELPPVEKRERHFVVELTLPEEV